ncbi:unnamed protein product, partial [Meganyctiphanes norvegica]
GTFMTVSTLHKVFNVEDNGQNLECVIEHSTFSEPDIAVVPITIYYSPVLKPVQTFYQIPLNGDYEVVLSFSANPRPTALKWSYGNNFEIQIPIDNGKFSTSLINHENGNYQALLRLAEITHEDIETHFKLHVENEIGATEYSVLLSMAHNPI